MSVPRPLVSERRPFISLIYIFSTILIGFVVIGPIVGLGAANFFVYHGDLLHDFEQGSGGEGFLEAGLVMQGIATFIGLILFPILHITQLEHKRLTPFFPAQPRVGEVLVAVTLLGLAFTVALSPVTEWNMHLQFPEFMRGFEQWATQEEERLSKITEALTRFDSVGNMLVGVLVIALLPAIGEELVFRGLIQRELWRGTANPHLSIWLAAAIFSAIHMQFFGFVPRLLLGALFGYLYYWSDNLLVPIFAHFFNNGFAVVMLYLHQNELTTINLEDDTAAPLSYVIVGFVITVGLLYFIWNHYRHNPPRPALPENVLSE